MKYLELLPTHAKTLKQSLKAIIHDNGKSEVIDLAYSKIPQLLQDKYDFIFSHKLLDGEALILHNFTSFLAVNDQFYQYNKKTKLDLKLKGRTLQIGSPLVDSTVTVSNEIAYFFVNELIDSVYPLPFRDLSFDNVIISEVLDYDLIKEASRVLKNNGKGYLIINAFSGVRPAEAIRAFSIRFITKFVKEMNGFWIIEGTKKN
ncbi:methyltransferase domain-containing protein [Sulfurisphaera javensis]|uniref:Methyltransferase domain-containing protein n=1 Tax=Sulfurisphaera javensis TaxID=2049879 RepID=A0AAT9GSP1_9CREN